MSVIYTANMLRSRARADAGGHVWMSMVHAPTDHKGQGSDFRRGINNYRLTVENERHRRLQCNSPRKSNNLDRKLAKKTLKNYVKDVKCSSPQ